jgi:hypothetical protein
MRFNADSTTLACKAIADTYVVILAWDLQIGQKSRLKNLGGFAIR